MSPTILRYKKYRFFFNSREEARRHVHVQSPDGTAKFWLEPLISLVMYDGVSERELNEIEKIVREHSNEFKKAWDNYFSL